MLDTQLTPELKRAGLAREVVNRVQRARKERDLPFEARIDLRYQTTDASLLEALEAEAGFIAEQTLSSSIEAGIGKHDERLEVQVDGAEFVFWISPRA